MVSPRALLAVLLVLAAAAFARSARAEEGFVLDNGAVLRGTLLREDDREIVLRLTGSGRENRVVLEKSRVTQRFVTVDARPIRPETIPARPSDPPARGDAPLPLRAVDTVPGAPLALGTTAPPLPEEEPAAREEDFFRRTARRALLAFPESVPLRAVLAALAILLLVALVEIGGRMMDVEGLTLGRSTALALLFAGLVAMNVLAPDAFLRADLAPIVILVQIVAWVGCAAGVLRCGIAAALQLLAFVVFATAIVVLVSGALLVTI